MSLYIQLLPFDHDSEIFSYSHTILSASQDQDIMDKLMEIEKKHGRHVPDKFHTYVGHHPEVKGETCYGKTNVTAYGEDLKYVHAKRIKGIKTDCYIDKAIWAYINELPDDTKIALYWK